MQQQATEILIVRPTLVEDCYSLTQKLLEKCPNGPELKKALESMEHVLSAASLTKVVDEKAKTF